MTTDKTIGDIIAERIAAKGWTTAHLTAALNDLGYDVQQQTVDRWVQKLNDPRVSVVPLIASALDCTPNDLIGFSAGGAA